MIPSISARERTPISAMKTIRVRGTPVGTALTTHGVTPKGDIDLGAFLQAQSENNPKYLHDGDVIEATIATDDGAINLGVQRNVVIYK